MDDELVGRPEDRRTGMSGAGPVFENAKAEQAAVRQRIQGQATMWTASSVRCQRSVSDLQAVSARRNRQDVRTVTRYEALDRVATVPTPFIVCPGS